MRHICIAMVVALGGCTTVETTHRPESYYTGAPQSDAAGLFKGEPGRLSDGEIERIINYRLTLPEQNRVAILVLSGASLWRFYSNDFVQLNEAIERDWFL